MKRVDNLLLIVLVLAMMFIVIYSWYSVADIDQETWAQIELDKSKSQQVSERRQYINLIFFQQTWIALAIFSLPMVLVLIQNRRLKKRIASKIERLFNKIKESHNTERTFIERLVATYSDISSYEVGLCEMLHQRMTSKEIATRLNVTPASINTARYRLRKKLDIPSEMNLITFLHQI